jgi:hypothetical protein
MLPLYCRCQVVKLKKFIKFENTVEALAAAAALVDSKLDKSTCSHLLAAPGRGWGQGRASSAPCVESAVPGGEEVGDGRRLGGWSGAWVGEGRRMITQYQTCLLSTES